MYAFINIHAPCPFTYVFLLVGFLFSNSAIDERRRFVQYYVLSSGNFCSILDLTLPIETYIS
jgi:hypothetical protein